MLSKLDLNLLRTLHILLEERSVTRAGERLGRTQSAVSNALRRLRETFDDPLFIRTPDGLTPTPRAVQLGAKIAQIVDLTEQCLEPDAHFDPTKAVARFVIGGPDRLSLPVFLPFLKKIRRAAQGVTVDIRTTDRDYAIRLISSQEIDLALGWFDEVPPQINRLKAAREPLVCLCQKDHPLLRLRRPPELDAILSYRHIVVSSGGNRMTAFDAILAQSGLRRDAFTTLNSFTMGPELLTDSDMIGVFTERTAEYFAKRYNLTTLPLPLAVQPIPLDLIWHRRFDADKIHAWLREQVVASCI